MLKRTLVVVAAVVACAALAGAALAVTQGKPSVKITGKVKGSFQSTATCFACGDMVKYVRADRVWCAWQGDNVIIHVRFRNSSVAHLTIHWHPSYEIAGGGSHGTGLSSLQSSGVNAHASRGVYVKQKPKGIPAGSRIASCKPAFEDVQTG